MCGAHAGNKRLGQSKAWMSTTLSMTRASKRRSKAKEGARMPGRREQAFFARLLGEEGVVVLEGVRFDEGGTVIVVGQVAGVEARAAEATPAGGAIDLT